MKHPLWMVGLVVLFSGVLWSPSADALIRLGGDVRWIPVAVETMEEDGETYRPFRQLESIGLGARFLLGFEQLGVGLKVNFSHHAFANPALSYSHLDINAHLRVMLPETRLALFAEAGPVMALNIGGIGYNGTFGLEVDVLGWPLVDLNLGLAAQYARVPVGAGPSRVRDHEGIRAMVFVGVDFSLMPGGRTR